MVIQSDILRFHTKGLLNRQRSWKGYYMCFALGFLPEDLVHRKEYICSSRWCKETHSLSGRKPKCSKLLETVAKSSRMHARIFPSNGPLWAEGQYVLLVAIGLVTALLFSNLHCIQDNNGKLDVRLVPWAMGLLVWAHSEIWLIKDILLEQENRILRYQQPTWGGVSQLFNSCLTTISTSPHHRITTIKRK